MNTNTAIAAMRPSRGYSSVLIAVLVFVAAGARGESDMPLSLIAYGSCCHQGRTQEFWDPIIRSKPDLFIFCGDNIYSDTFDMRMMKHKYAQLASQPGFRSLKVACPILATWDDHDFGLNDSGGEFPAKEQARQVFLDFWRVPPASPRRNRPGVYDAQIIGPKGKRVQVILLDTRFNRSALAETAVRTPNKGHFTATRDPNATILGAAQWKWLEAQLKQPAEIRLLISSIQLVAQDHNWEKWMNFPGERAKFLRIVHSTRANGLIVLSGDRHHAELSAMRSALVGYRLYDMTSSGLNMTHEDLGYEPNRYRVGRTVVVQNNFGTVGIDWSKRDPIITLQIRSMKGTPLISESFPLGQLRPES